MEDAAQITIGAATKTIIVGLCLDAGLNGERVAQRKSLLEWRVRWISLRCKKLRDESGYEQRRVIRQGKRRRCFLSIEQIAM